MDRQRVRGASVAQRKVRERPATALRDAGGLWGWASPDISIFTTHGAVTPALDRRTPDAVYFEQSPPQEAA